MDPALAGNAAESSMVDLPEELSPDAGPIAPMESEGLFVDSAFVRLQEEVLRAPQHSPLSCCYSP